MRKAYRQTKKGEISDEPSYTSDNTQPTESVFSQLVQRCEQRLHDILQRKNMPLTPQWADRIALQAEMTATFVLHSHGETRFLPEEEMVNLSLRAKYELDRLPEIQQELMDDGEENAFRAYQITDRLASIEGLLYFESLIRGTESHHPSFDAKRELTPHREQLPYFVQELKQAHFLSDVAAQNCAQDILRCKETHGENPSEGQISKMLQISREVEHKEYGYHSYSDYSSETQFLRRREGDFLFKHGSSYDVSRDLDSAQVQKNL